MADNNDADIRIGIKTEADTKGAQETKTALTEVEKATQEAQRKQDVATAQQRVATKVEKENAAALREIADMQYRIVAANLSQAIGQIGQSFSGLSAEMDMVIQSSTNFFNVLASTGRIELALVSMAATAAGSVLETWKAATGQITAGEQKVKESFEKLQRARAAWAESVRTQKLEAVFQRELDALEDQELVLGRLLKLRQAERDLAAAKESAAGTAATRAGGDPFAAEAQGIFTQQQNAIAEIQNSLEVNRKSVANAQSKANLLKAEADTLAENFGEDGSAFKSAKAAADAAQKEAQKLSDALPDLEKIAALNVEKIKTDFEEKSGDLADKAGRDLAEKAKAQIEAVQAKAAESGEAVSMNMQGIISRISTIVADGLVESKELPALRDQLTRIATTRESNDREIFDGFSRVVKATETLTGLLPSLKSRIATLEADVSNLKNAPQ